MVTPFTESVVEEAALAWLADLGYTTLNGPEIAVGMPLLSISGMTRFARLMRD